MIYAIAIILALVVFSFGYGHGVVSERKRVQATRSAAGVKAGQTRRAKKEVAARPLAFDEEPVRGGAS